jgi:hypothetical protein
MTFLKVVDIMQTGAEPVDAAGNNGPELIKNGDMMVFYICVQYLR